MKEKFEIRQARMKSWCGYEDIEKNVYQHEAMSHENEIIETPGGIVRRRICLWSNKYKDEKFTEVKEK